MNITEQMVVDQKNDQIELKVNKNIYYLEKRPKENGRVTLIKNNKEILPQEYSIKSKVHEYGGGSYCISDNLVLFINKKDQEIYKIYQNKITKLTNSNCRFADGVIDENEKFSYWVMEEHNDKVNNYIVQVNNTNGKVTILNKDYDFYSSPQINKNQLAFISWNHPNMPWDNTFLNLLNIKTKENKKLLTTDWNSQPKFHKDNLYVIKESGNWSNIFKLQNNKFINLNKEDKEYGVPQWKFGNSTYSFYEDNILATCYNDIGEMELKLIGDETKNILTEYKGFSDINLKDDYLFCFAYSYDKPKEIIKFNLQTHKLEKLKKASPISFKVHKPQNVWFDSYEGKCQGFLYHPDFKNKYPLIVISHGGPTGKSDPFYDITIQYWLDKGFSVFDVNYRGSTGFGKEYRNALKGNWGVLDIKDCENAARYCIDNKFTSPETIAIRGSSAGGFTTMASLTFSNVFKAGASYYGICDLDLLAQQTHKFESQYMDSLIAPYPEHKEIYKNRSPNNFLDQINCPMIIFQGKDDFVVPVNQAQTIHDNLKAKDIDSQLFIFKDEGHGFSKEENIITCLKEELKFYKSTFDIA